MIVSAGVAAPTVLRDTLATIPEIVSLVTGASNELKVYWLGTSKATPLPYIITQYYMPYGEKDPRYADDLWLVYGQTASPAAGAELAAAIEKLNMMEPVMASYPELECAKQAPLRVIYPYQYRYQAQNEPIFKLGSIVRVRLYLGEFDNGN